MNNVKECNRTVGFQDPASHTQYLLEERAHIAIRTMIKAEVRQELKRIHEGKWYIKLLRRFQRTKGRWGIYE